MPDNELPVVAVEQIIVPENKKDVAFMLPVKEEIEGFVCHAFAKMRKGFIYATGNELMKTQQHIDAYKKSNPDWETKSVTTGCY